MVVNFELEKIQSAAANFLQCIANKNIIAFRGEMGAGKTTFIRALCQILGVSDAISSPTFSIINEYRAATGESIFHIDLYRLTSEQEALNAGVAECFYSGNKCFVEWPELYPGLFPDDTVWCDLLSEYDNRRQLKISL